MSCDYAVWFPYRHLSNREAGVLYSSLCDGDTSGVQQHPAIEAFYDELVAMHPQIDDIPESQIGDHDLCPWSIAFDRSPAHLIMCCVWSKADYVDGLLRPLAARHGLALYDPQSDVIHYHGDSSTVGPSFDTPPDEASTLPRWVQIVVGLMLSLLLLPCLAGAVMMMLVPNEQAPVVAPIGGVVMTVMALWLFGICFRLVSGRRTVGGLMSPRMLRTIAWVFLLLPVGGLFTGYFATHTTLAFLQSAAYISVFFGLRSLAQRRDKQTKTGGDRLPPIKA